ncbi:type VI secretion system lipoprotein TssJ [Sphaerotilus sp.]|uniref:type VI secretion system lipoprotein TssJ n=1 Tax=Sphaerotilus sp. TaxID=2093942 RepID=UPI002ACE1B4A|nr:type VI secretion system lipoprotein TssJ [Sphaerotilus sp.]MDZ7856470.1 type VI secretion system lipoprotein TssJ [Sphaerotilus sp.]
MSNASEVLRRAALQRLLNAALAGPVTLAALSGCALGGAMGGKTAEAPRKPLLAGLLTPDPTLLNLQITTTADANPDARRRASPLVLRVYELSGHALFDTADFLALFERDRETLGPEMLGKQEWVMPPGTVRVLDKTLAPEVRHLGIVAGYRDLERARWRLVVPVKAQMRNAVRVRADARAVTLDPADAGAAR